MLCVANRRCGPGSLRHRTCCRCIAHGAKEPSDCYTVLPRLPLLTVQLLGHSLQIGLAVSCPALSTAKGGSRNRLPRSQGRETSLASSLLYWREVACATTEFEPGGSVALHDQPPQGVVVAHIERMALAWCLYCPLVPRVTLRLHEVGNRRHSHRTRGGMSTYCLSQDSKASRLSSGRCSGLQKWVVSLSESKGSRVPCIAVITTRRRRARA